MFQRNSFQIATLQNFVLWLSMLIHQNGMNTSVISCASQHCLQSPSISWWAEIGHQLLGIPRSGPLTWYLHDPSERAGALIHPGCVLHPDVTSERWKTLGTQWRESAHTPGNLGSASSWSCLPLTNDGTAQPACLASSYSSIQWDDNHPALWEGRRTLWKVRKNNALGKGEPSLQFTQP